MKEVTQLDDYGFFVGFTSADESPLEKGVYHLPRNTVDAPDIPTLDDTGERAKWVDGAWLVVPPEPIPEPTPEPTLAQERTAMQMSRQKFAVLAAEQGWVTEDEALGWLAGNSIPQVAEDAIASQDKEVRFVLRSKVMSQAVIYRNDMLIGVLMKTKNVSELDMDELFRGNQHG